MRVYTICTQSYLAYAAVLAESLAQHHGGLRLAVLVTDADASTKLAFDADLILPTDLPLGDPDEYHRMATIYDVVELATALKPWVFQYFLDRSGEPVVYLDPDIQVFAPLHDIGELAAKHGIVLNPHTTQPLPRDGKMPSERELLIAGTYNLGFLAVGPAGRPFLDWWAERLRRDCLNAVEDGLFVDQRWIDLVPSYFDHAVLRDPGCNVAYWNLPTRRVEQNGSGYLVDGVPLRFFHFSGFSPDTPHLLSKHQMGEPRIRLEDHPALASLCREYAQLLRRHGYARYSRIPYRYDMTATGMRLTRSLRRIYRDELLLQEAQGRAPSMPDPFTAAGAERLLEMWREPFSAEYPKVTRYMHALYRGNSELHDAFPHVPGRDADRYASWLRAGGVVEEPVPEELLATESALEPGVNLYGYVFAESGTGQIGRSIVAALKAAEIPYAVIPFVETVNRQEHRFADRGHGRAIYDTNLICVNADQVPVFIEKMGREILHGRYNIGVWAWEVDDMPESMARNAGELDEVWGISEYTAAAIRRRVHGPVRAFPLPVVPSPPVSRSRKDLGFPEGFLFLFCFDFASVFERKNPLGLIDAFRRAFPKSGEAFLAIKSVNGDRHPADLQRLRAAVADRKDILILDGYRESGEQMALMNACDVYVSLHRSEGFGLTVAEAMSLGKPVICTAYSSTTEFTTNENSYVVPARVVPVPAGTPVYPPTARWAEPDVAVAATLMRRAFDHAEEARTIGERARQDILELHSPEARATRLRALVDESRRAKDARAAKGSGAPVRSFIVPLTGASAADDHAKALMARPNPDLPSRFPWIAKTWRRLMLRLIRNYWVHQRDVDRALLEAVATSREGLRLEMRSLADAVAQRIQSLEERVAASERAHRAAIEALEKRIDELKRENSESERTVGRR